MLRAAALAATVALPAAALALPGTATAADPGLSRFVNPLIGTANAGNIPPGAATPFGMVQFGPDNSSGNQALPANPNGYEYGRDRIRGFSMTHISGSGCQGASGDLPWQPYAGAVDTSPTADVKDEKYATGFSHADEQASAGRYRVRTKDGITTELSATTRTGAMRVAYPEGKPASLLLRTSNSIAGSENAITNIDPENRTISGWVRSGNFCGDKTVAGTPGRRSYYTLHFTAKFDRDFQAHGTWKDGTLNAGADTAEGGTSYAGGSAGGVSAGGGRATPGKGSGGYVTFDTTQDRDVEVRVGLSYVDADGAERNLAEENPDGDTAAVAAKAAKAWDDRLAQIDVTGGSTDRRTVFYTALYHSLQHMNVFSDVDGRYRSMDPQETIATKAPSQDAQYATFSGWDVYRTQIQLVSLLDPKVASDMAQSLLNNARQDVNGRWSRWSHAGGAVGTMTGDPAPPFVASALAFGATDWDVAGGLESLVRAADVPTPEDTAPGRIGWPNMSPGQRPSLDKYLALHFMPDPSNAWGGAGETLENTVSDFSLAQMARRSGDGALADRFTQRSQWWQNQFHLVADPLAGEDGGYIQNRNEDRTWHGFDPASEAGFSQGSAARYVWNLPHNVGGLFAAMGGRDRAAGRLERYFRGDDGDYLVGGGGNLRPDVGNQPSILSPWLFAWAGQPYKTQAITRQAVTETWTNMPGGIPGNDDLGAMSAWHVWAALGVYPAIPGRAELVIGSPIFTKAVIKRRNGRTITIEAPETSSSAVYVQSAQLDGAPLDRAWLTEAFAAGDADHTLRLTMGEAPNTTWGGDEADAPPSFGEGMQPVIAATKDSALIASDGGTDVTTLVLQSTSKRDVRIAVAPKDLPAGATLGVEGGEVAVPAGKRVEVPLRLRAAADAPVGQALVDLGLRVVGGETLEPTVARVVLDDVKPLAELRDNVGISRDSDRAEGAIDDCCTMSADALAVEGVTRGTKVAIDGFAYTWPDVDPGRPDNMLAAGQQIAVAAEPGATRLGVLGNATLGNATTEITVRYTDGTRSTERVTFGDWVRGGGGNAREPRNLIAVKSSYRNHRTSGRQNMPTLAFSVSVPVDGTKTVASVAVGKPSANVVHVFDVDLAAGAAKPIAELFNTTGAAIEGQRGWAELDYTRHALSIASLREVGLASGEPVATKDGFSYRWPVTDGKRYDNVDAWGQRIALQPVAKATRIGLLATATKGPSTSKVIVGYADGGTTESTVTLADWTPNGSSLAPGVVEVARSARRVGADNGEATGAQILSASVPVAAGRVPAWVQVDRPNQGAVHLFDVATVADPAPQPEPDPEPGDGDDGDGTGDGNGPGDGNGSGDGSGAGDGNGGGNGNGSGAPAPRPAPAPAPTPAPATAPRAARAAVVAPARVRLDRRGRMAVRVRCASAGGCRVRVLVRTGSGRKARTVGRSRPVTVGKGRVVLVRVTLTASARRTVVRRRGMAVRVTAGATADRTRVLPAPGTSRR
jgi:predicted alpha-1,2-mannosidase